MSALVVVLVLVGLALLLVERHVRTRGSLRATGIAALIAAFALVILRPTGNFAVAVALSVPILAALSAFALTAIRLTLSAGRRRARCGAEGLVGHVGVVRRPLDPLGYVAIDGELWRARRSWAEEDDPPPAEGENVVVDHVQGLTVTVRRAEIWEVER